LLSDDELPLIAQARVGVDLLGHTYRVEDLEEAIMGHIGNESFAVVEELEKAILR
jgi:hypothetical protein